jgi:hypothetical protein
MNTKSKRIYIPSGTLMQLAMDRELSLDEAIQVYFLQHLCNPVKTTVMNLDELENDFAMLFENDEQ